MKRGAIYIFWDVSFCDVFNKAIRCYYVFISRCHMVSFSIPLDCSVVVIRM